MASTPSSAEKKVDQAADASEQKEQDLATIDGLVDACRARLSGVSGGLLSSATKASLDTMWRELRTEAERDDLRAERLAWAQGAMALLDDTIEKASDERARFEADLNDAVQKKWIRPDSAEEWMRKFEDPGLLEMRRSMWIKEEWKGYKARWAALARDRQRVLASVRGAGLTRADIPEIATLANDAAFLAKDRSYQGRRSLVDTVEAAIVAADRKKTALLRSTETFLKELSSGPERSLDPSKVGQWLKRMMASDDPERFRTEVIGPFALNWKEARAAYDELSRDYDAQGKPDGCMPMPVNAFLRLPYEARMTAIAEGRNRLAAARTLEEGTDDDLDAELRDIRRSVDLKDLDAVEVRLAGLRVEHPYDEDVRSISAHVAMLRAERDKNEEPERTEEERTEDAMASLREMQEKLPTSVATFYGSIIESGNVRQATLVFASMKAHADRVRSGKISKDEAAATADMAEETDEATIVERAPADGASAEPADASLLVSTGTPPEATVDLLKEHGAKDPKRYPGLVFDLTADQHLQLVELNERALADMRHLENVGKRYEKTEKAVAA